MKLNVCIETSDPDIEAALEELNGNKGKYLTMALENYYYSLDGRVAFKKLTGKFDTQKA